MKQGLSLRVSQNLALTPQLQQAIRLLQLSTLDMEREVAQMLDDNPFLEREHENPVEEFGLPQADSIVRDDYSGAAIGTSSNAQSGSESNTTETQSSEPADFGATLFEDAPNWDGDGSFDLHIDDSEWGGDAKPKTNNIDSQDHDDVSELARQQESLTAFLHTQALALRLGEEDTAALRFLIESLNEDGYLEESLAALAMGLAGGEASDDDIDELLHRLTVALRLLQSLEPAGVAARDLGECLSLQLRAILQQKQNPLDAETQALVVLALRICAQPMDLLARRDIRRLNMLCQAPDSQVKAAILFIARLEPKPGRRFISVERNIVLPDVIVKAVGNATQPEFRVELNPDVMPRLRVQDIYANALRQHKGGNAEALQQRLQEARWFIKSIQQRFETILRVSNAIVVRQRSFFVHGEMAMRPLILREIAEELGLHESTISRVTTAKYMLTPYGTYELKYFFGSGLDTEAGGSASSIAVRALIKQLIAAENPKKPISDQSISVVLKEQGIECARRTVAKYREALRIAPTHLRKVL